MLLGDFNAGNSEACSSEFLFNHNATNILKNKTYFKRISNPSPFVGCFLANFAKFFSLKFYLKRDSGTGIFLWILQYCSVCNFIKTETPARVFSCKFWETFQSLTLLRTRLAQVFSCELYKIFKKTFFAKHLRKEQADVEQSGTSLTSTLETQQSAILLKTSF